MEEELIAADQQKMNINKGNGRRKIGIDKISNINKRRTSLSKRHKGLFNKAAKLKQLFPAAEVAVIVRYPSGKFKTSETDSEIFSVINHFIAEQGELSGKEPIQNREYCFGTSAPMAGNSVLPEISQNFGAASWVYPELERGQWSKSNEFCNLVDELFRR